SLTGCTVDMTQELDLEPGDRFSGRISHRSRYRARRSQADGDGLGLLTGGDGQPSSLSAEHTLTVFLPRVPVADGGDAIRTGRDGPEREPAVAVGDRLRGVRDGTA